MAKAECGKCGCACACGKSRRIVKKRKPKRVRPSIPLAMMMPTVVSTLHQGITTYSPFNRESLAIATEQAIKPEPAIRKESVAVGTDELIRPMKTSRSIDTAELQVAEAIRHEKEQEFHRQELMKAKQMEKVISQIKERQLHKQHEKELNMRTMREKALRRIIDVNQEQIKAIQHQTIPIGREREQKTLGELEELVRGGYTIQARRSKYKTTLLEDIPDET